ncbi:MULTISPECIES: hypothetical protein [unclassified Pseudomonas]|uniref:hypothetical protein n=1 Tax=unclassified Pseudomonas TaxID=196821 RepID=UPI00131BB38C|nr:MULTISPECIES: hypothetical protein [unclassified Pseudomonas]
MSQENEFGLPDQVVKDLYLSMENIGLIQEQHGQDGLVVLNFSTNGLIAASAGGVITSERLDTMAALVEDLRSRLTASNEHNSESLLVARFDGQTVDPKAPMVVTH